MSGAAGAAGIGAAGSIIGSKGGAGGKKGQQSNMEGLYKEFQSILTSGMNLYQTAAGSGPDGLKATDERALADYQKTIMTQAQSALGAYDASAAAKGSGMGQSDTQKDRAKTQISEGYASQVGALKYGQDESYLSRLQALLPGTGSATSGFGGAGALDAQNSNRQSGILNGILQLAGLIPGSQGKSPQNPFDPISSYHPGGGITGGGDGSISNPGSDIPSTGN